MAVAPASQLGAPPAVPLLRQEMSVTSLMAALETFKSKELDCMDADKLSKLHQELNGALGSVHEQLMKVLMRERSNAGLDQPD